MPGSGLLGSIEKVLADIKNAGEKGIHAIIQEIKTKIHALPKDIESEIHTLTAEVRSRINTVLTVLRNKLGELEHFGKSELSEGSSKLHTISEMFKTAFEKIVAVFERAITDIRIKIESLAASTKKSLSGVANTLERTVKTYMSKIKTYIETGTANILKELKAEEVRIIHGARAMGGSIKSHMKSAYGNVKELTETIYADFSKMIASIGKKSAHTIERTVADAKSAVNEASSGIVQSGALSDITNTLVRIVNVSISIIIAIIGAVLIGLYLFYTKFITIPIQT